MNKMIVSLSLVALLAGSAFAQQSGLVIYPAKGQGKEQQEQDQFACYGWAKGESGFDPMAPPAASTPPPAQEASKGGVVRGGARGAIVGGIVDGSDGAKTGAGVGAVVGGARRADQRRQQAHQQEQWQQQQAQQQASGRANYDRYYGACMEGRGYTVR